MVLKIISFIFVISLVLSFAAPIQPKEASFKLNEVNKKVTDTQYKKQIPNYEAYNAERSDNKIICGLQGEEFLVDTCITYIPALGSQEASSAAFDGTNYFIVWRDSRNGHSNIYGTRLNQDGIVLNPAGIVITTMENCQYTPSVAFDGTNYFVAWIVRKATVMFSEPV
ncbi:MAG: hypothetical protein OEZ20_07390 [candidate division WOR-3 bacterium]|nr:hypothetical protein [candidate division WOR-3 bacterium]MDH5684270.1 hypothetical protein [candidate division WOR-3 bacterium]